MDAIGKIVQIAVCSTPEGDERLYGLDEHGNLWEGNFSGSGAYWKSYLPNNRERFENPLAFRSLGDR